MQKNKIAKIFGLTEEFTIGGSRSLSHKGPNDDTTPQTHLGQWPDLVIYRPSVQLLIYMLFCFYGSLPCIQNIFMKPMLNTSSTILPPMGK